MLMDDDDFGHISMLTKYSGLCPITIKNSLIIIPNKYYDMIDECIEIYNGRENNGRENNDSLNKTLDINFLPATQKIWDIIREMLVSCAWLQEWYDDSSPTPKTTFVELKKNICVSKVIFDKPKFIRLDSISPKDISKNGGICSTFNEAYSLINSSQRCKDAIEIAYRIGKTPSICIRDIIDISQGYQFRCYLFDYKLVAIGSNDTLSLPNSVTTNDIKKACIRLHEKIINYIPSPDCVMDVFINNNACEIGSYVIEFNSYGYWGNASGGMFDWIEDAAILYGLDITADYPIMRLDTMLIV